MNCYTHPNYDNVKIVEAELIELSKIDFALCAQPKETLESYYNRQTVKPEILVNGGLFCVSNGETCFTFMDEGIPIKEIQDYPFGIGITGDKTLVYGPYSDLKEKVRDYITAYPPLVIDGELAGITYAREIDYNARRTAFGYNEEKLFIVTVDAPGMTFERLQTIMRDLGCKYAINLDGGGSTRLIYRGTLVTAAGFSRPIDSVVAIYTDPQMASTRTIYRIQLGAFSSEVNARSLLSKIQVLDDPLKAGYHNAFICKVDDLYKVQVGAYSVYQSAVKVKQDLESKGYTPFITKIVCKN